MHWPLLQSHQQTDPHPRPPPRRHPLHGIFNRRKQETSEARQERLAAEQELAKALEEDEDDF